MLYTEILYLVSLKELQDEIGNIVYEESQRKIYAKKNAVGSKEFYNAVAAGITPTAELQIKLSEYNDEKEVIYNDKRYCIVRTIPKNRNDLVLVLSVKQGVVNG